MTVDNKKFIERLEAKKDIFSLVKRRNIASSSLISINDDDFEKYNPYKT